MSEYRLAEKPALDALTALGYRRFTPEAAMAMRDEENRVLLSRCWSRLFNGLNGISAADAEAIYGDLSTLSDNEDWQRKLRGGYSRRLAGEARDQSITLIDFKHPIGTRYHVVRQFRVAAQRPADRRHRGVRERHPACGHRGQVAPESDSAGGGGVRANQAV